MTSPADDVRQLMEDNGVNAAPWQLKTGEMPVEPPTIIACFDITGREPNPKWGWDEPSVSVQLRGERYGYAAARQKAQEIKDLLLGRAETEINGSVYTLWRMSGDINFIGNDENMAPMFSMNFLLGVRPATLGNRKPL